MLELKDIHLKGKEIKNTPINMSFNNGLTVLPYSKKTIFNSLILKDDLFIDGTFKVDDITFLPNDINALETLCVLSISSQVLCLTLVYVTSKKEKKDFIVNVQNRFLNLKEMPLESDEDKDNKIKKIFENTLDSSPSYVLIDFNNEINTKYQLLISKNLEEIKDKLTFVVLNSLENEPKYSTIDISSNNYEPNKDKKDKSKHISSNKNLEIFKNLFQKEWTSFLLIAFELLFCVFSSLLAPFYFSTGELGWGVTLSVLSAVCLIAQIIFICLCTEPYLKENKKLEFKYSLISLICFALISIGLGYLIFYLLLANNVIVKQENFNNLLFLPSIIVSIISLTVTILIKYVSKPYFYLRKKIISKYKKDKK